MNIRQDEKESLSDFHKRFKNAKNIMESQYGKLQLTEYVKIMPGYDESDDAKVKELNEEAYDSFLAYAFIEATSNRAGRLSEDLANRYAIGQNEYPKDLNKAIDAVMNNRDNTSGRKKVQSNNHNNQGQKKSASKEEGSSFAQKGSNKSDKEGKKDKKQSKSKDSDRK